MTAFAVLTLWSTPVLAWLDGGHMQIAALAYTRLTTEAKSKVDALIKLNPDYPAWVKGVPADQVGWLAFVRASVWADDIKMKGPGYTNVRMQDHGYTNDGYSPKGPEAGQNIGYSDLLMHNYWHFKNIGFSTDGTPIPPADAIDAVSQINLFKAALPSSSGATDDVRSYDLVWLIHLVGDAHQPLHAATRYSKEFPQGDNGGNAEMVTPATGEVLLLHVYWDRLLGGFVTPESAVHDAMCDPYPTRCADGGLVKVQVDSDKASKDDPEVWFKESFELAKEFAYAEPVCSGGKPILLTRDYETQARNMALKQAALAAQRLANMLNAAFQ
jgi:hypothetical protein